MKSFSQRTILERVDCCLVHTEDQKKFYSTFHSNVYLVTSPPKEVATNVRQAKSLFIHPDGFNSWFNVLAVLHSQSPLAIKLLIFSASDLPLTDVDMEDWISLFPEAKFWIQNYTGSLANCSLFPIGVNKQIEFVEQQKTQPLVLSYFNPENSKERNELQLFLKTQASLEPFCLPQLSVDKYLEKMSNAYFSVCPSGNGYDSYRFWESLSVGSIPLVISTPFLESLMEHHPELPFMMIETWSDLLSFLHSNIQQVYDMYMVPSNLEIMSEEYWMKKFDEIHQISGESETPNTKEEVSLSETDTKKI